MKNRKLFYITTSIALVLAGAFVFKSLVANHVFGGRDDDFFYSDSPHEPKIDASGLHENTLSTPSHTKDSSETLTMEAKIEREKELNQLAVKDMVIMSGVSIYNALIEKGVILEPGISARIKSESMTAKDLEVLNMHIAELSTEEENFKIELSQYRNFHDMKVPFEKRAALTGLFYGNEFLSQPTAYRGMNFDDARQLLDSGAVLPENVLSNIVMSENIDLAVQLHEAGVNINPNYVDKYRSMNVIEMFAENYAINPYSASVDDQINKLQKLNDLGVAVKVNDGTRDALDIVLNGALHHESKEAKNLLALAQHLNRMGISVEKSHIQLLEKIKSKHPDLYSEYVHVLR